MSFQHQPSTMSLRRPKRMNLSMDSPVKKQKTQHKDRDGSISRFIQRFMTRQELFFDALLPFLTVEDIMRVCQVLSTSRSVDQSVLSSAKWKYLMNRDGLKPPNSTEWTQTVTSPVGCREITEYLSRLSQWQSFNTGVVVEAGDLSDIQLIGNQKVDCLIFPTSSTNRNPGIGVSGCVHQRAGPQLNMYVEEHCKFHYALPGNILLSPGFNLDVKLLVHCVGPAGVGRDRKKQLYLTYIHALKAIEKDESIQCAAIASISTGNMRYQPVEASRIAMAAVCDMVRTRRWTKKLAFVCIEKKVLDAFTEAHEEQRHSFFTANCLYPDILYAPA